MYGSPGELCEFFMKSTVVESRHTASDASHGSFSVLSEYSFSGFLPTIRQTSIKPALDQSSPAIEVSANRAPSGDGTGIPHTLVESPVESSTIK
jgi:hypothetical protein